MNREEIIQEISKKDFKRRYFAGQVLKDEGLRGEIVQLMLEHPQIMVYYHAFYILSDASRILPELFYPYWDGFVSLLKHSNSYQRDFGLVLLSNLAGVDDPGRFEKIFEDYFACLNDPRFMTAQCCVRSSANILLQKTHLAKRITRLLLEFEQFCDYPLRQKALLKADVLEILAVVYSFNICQQEIRAFVKEALDSASPKTRREAKILVQQLELDKV